MKNKYLKIIALVTIIIIGTVGYNLITHIKFGCIESQNYNSVDDFLIVKDTPYVAKINGKYYHSKNANIDDQFFIGSMTKVFTATLIFHLQKLKKLSIEDSVNKYIKNPKLDNSVKIKNLLNHTSGIADSDDVFEIIYDNQEKLYTTKDFLKGSKYTKNKEYLYSNSNYILLGEIIEKVSGDDFYTYAKKVILNELNMPNTCLEYEKDCNPHKGHLNMKLLEREDKYTRMKSYNSFTSLTGSAGNLVSNIEDLEKFLTALAENKFFDLSKMMKEYNNEAYRFGIRKYKENYYGHGGQTLDTISIMMIDIENKKQNIMLIGDSDILTIEDIVDFLITKGEKNQ